MQDHDIEAIAECASGHRVRREDCGGSCGGCGCGGVSRLEWQFVYKEVGDAAKAGLQLQPRE